MTEIYELYADGMSACCNASVIDPSGEDKEGRCMDCKEMTEVIQHEHTDSCIEVDIYDGGDDGDGYHAYETVNCKITGGRWE